MNTNMNKRKRRHVLVNPGDTQDFVIDEEDYHVVCKILSNAGVQSVELHKVKMVDKVENDEEQRVCKLNIYRSGITSIPPSVGHLKNFRHLNLGKAEKLLNLPKEIGDLVSLNRLTMPCSDITSLPSSVGRLKNLKELDLSYTKKLLNLPKDIGDLISLNTLVLHGSDITSLPHSIERSKNLQTLNLSHTEQLLNLPEAIGDLISLEELNLRLSNIASFPPSIGHLKNLNCLKVGNSMSHYPGARKIYYGIACNISRSRIGFGATGSKYPVPMSLKLWPLVLHNATRAFQPFRSNFNSEGEVCHKILDLKKAEAIYKLLVDGRESFLGVLLNRETTDQGTT